MAPAYLISIASLRITYNENVYFKSTNGLLPSKNPVKLIQFGPIGNERWNDCDDWIGEIRIGGTR